VDPDTNGIQWAEPECDTCHALLDPNRLPERCPECGALLWSPPVATETPDDEV
jgi:hypothetical protein